MKKTTKQLLTTLVTLPPLVYESLKAYNLQDLKHSYGRLIDVYSKKMNIYELGSYGRPVIVINPGLGSPSPGLEFLPLAERLASYYRVVIVEPLGYGLSDHTFVARKVKNIVDELHTCLHNAGYTEYYLMGHSVSGIYDLYYCNHYPNEVKGFIGLDPSTPKQDEIMPFQFTLMEYAYFDISRILDEFGISLFTTKGKHYFHDKKYPYSNRQKEIYRKLNLYNAHNITIRNELDCMSANLKVIRKMKFPNHIPVVMFVSKENTKRFPEWLSLHAHLLNDNPLSKMFQLNADHYVHLAYPLLISRVVRNHMK